MIIKSLVVTALLCSYSVRTPVIENLPVDYEIRTGMNFKIQKSKYNIKSQTCILYEREIGLHGWGHDFNLIYNKQDKLLKKLLSIDLIYYRQFTSYERQVKDMNVQTIDTGYKIKKWFKIGYSVISKKFKKYGLMYYSCLDLRYLVFELRFNEKKIISHFKLETEIPLKNNVYIKPLFKYIQIEDKKDYWSKLEIGYKL